MQANSDADEVDLLLIVTLLKYICGEEPYQREEEGGVIMGAVLVFLPGFAQLHCAWHRHAIPALFHIVVYMMYYI